MRLSTLTLLLLPLLASAQTPLPYASGFDNAGQQAGWQQFRTGYENNYPWAINNFGSPSPPSHLWHDYPVGGSENDTIRDWYVSPPFDFSGGASLTLKVNVYSITGSTTPSDAMKIMLLNGSNDPDAATVTELADLSPLVTSASAFTQIPAVSVPPTAGTSYIAFYYQATNNWFTPGIDDVAITAAPIGIGELVPEQVDVVLLTDPSSLATLLEVHGAAVQGSLLHLRLFGLQGALLVERSFRDRTALGTSLATGTYHYTLAGQSGATVARGRICLVR